jgi:hypothetical protein
MEESLLGQIFTKRVYRVLTGNPLKSNIMIKFDKNVQNMDLKRWVESYECFLEMDYSQFDSTVPNFLIEMAFEVIRGLFKMTEKEQNIFNYLKRNFIKSKIVLPDGSVVMKETGIPSGSSFTSLIGSIVNYIIIKTVMKRLDLKDEDYDALVFGDDSLVGIKKEIKNKEAFKKQVIHLISFLFGMTVKEDEIKIVHDKYVSYLEPIYSEKTTGGTSHLKPLDFKKLTREPEHGEHLTTSHRWFYGFAQTWKFLSYSMKEDGSMIRPTSEIMERLLCPETPIRTMDQHITALKMALLENLDNKHTENRIYFYLYDCYWLVKHRVQDSRILHRRIRIRNREEDSPGLGARMWFRRSNEYYDLWTEPCMAEFNKMFMNILISLRTIKHSGVTSDSGWYSFKRRVRGQSLEDFYRRAGKKKNTTIFNLMSNTLNKKDVEKMYLVGKLLLERENSLEHFFDILKKRGRNFETVDSLGLFRKASDFFSKHGFKRLWSKPVPKVYGNLEFWGSSPLDDNYHDDYDEVGILFKRKCLDSAN